MPELQPFLGALPPAFAILFSLIYGSGKVAERNAQRIFSRAKMPSKHVTTATYVLSGALAVESFLVTMFAAFLSLAIVIIQYTVASAGAEILLLILIVIILTGFLFSLRILFVYDYIQLATYYVENRALRRLFGNQITYSSYLRVTEIGMSAAVALAIVGAALI